MVSPRMEAHKISLSIEINIHLQGNSRLAMVSPRMEAHKILLSI